MTPHMALCVHSAAASALGQRGYCDTASRLSRKLRLALRSLILFKNRAAVKASAVTEMTDAESDNDDIGGGGGGVNGMTVEFETEAEVCNKLFDVLKRRRRAGTRLRPSSPAPSFSPPPPTLRFDEPRNEEGSGWRPARSIRVGIISTSSTINEVVNPRI
mmetsp:Transcript_57176/g.114695  ORF Transcript_57176/g.114695 Transcript_57176/m.114695 type:complete len:160 (-) Transcript_57176:190-669(-)